ncbi:SRRM2 protein homolog rsr-2-like [Malaclemys terrapin pileata]|uniref:SRRM2 protein homolog rsr-2-like n=1 Tax=Malaclemys terrapin pileata TaxID=2991368 RepID=UPI0023A7A417|nr:SRRM2 protein homolog rsr-2-like [Malaclemys terrapin pileata]
MMERGHNRDSDQCRVKVKELRQAYQKTKEANGRSGSEPRTCRFYAELHAILGGAATTTPPVIVDSGSGIVSSATPEDSANGGEEEDEDELAESTQHSVLPNSQDLFLTLTEVPSQASQASTQDSDPMEGTSAAANSSSLPPPSRRLSQIRRRKKRTRDEMFSEIMESSRSDRAHLNEWKETVSKYRKEASEREDRRDQREDRRDQREDRRDQREERRDARDERWRQEDQRRQDATLGLLREQTDMLRRLVELQERLLENRLPLQPLFHPPPSPCSVSSSPRRVRTRGGEAPYTFPFHPSRQPKQKAVIFLTFSLWLFPSQQSSSQIPPGFPPSFSNLLIKNK